LAFCAVNVTAEVDLALSLDGVDDYVEAPLVWTPTSFSVAWWLNPRSRKEWNQQLGPGWGQFLFHTDANGGVWVGTDVNNRFTDTDIPADTVVLNEWQYFVYTYDNSAAKFYKNGTLLASKDNGSVQRWSRFLIGNDRSDGHTIDGLVNEVSVWNRTLTEQEIQTTMCAKLQGNESGLIACWNFDDGTANDLTANGNDGTFQNNPGFSDAVPSELNGFLQGDGNSYVSIPANDSYTSDQFTVAFWVRLPDRSNHFKGMVDRGQPTRENWWFLTNEGGSPQGVRLGVPAGGGSFAEQAYTWGDSDWHHVAGTVDGETSASLYVDGVLRATLHGSYVTNPLNDIAIGARLGGGERLKGDIDEVTIWNKALTQEEIRTAMCAKLRGNESGLVGYWNFDDGTANDQSGNGNHGTIHGNGCLSLDGVDDYVECSNNLSLNFDTGSFTLQCWFKTDFTDNLAHQMIAKEGYGWTSGYFVRIDQQKLNWSVTGVEGMDNSSYSSGATIVTDGEWHHAALVVDRSTDDINVTAYLDGVPDGNSSVVNSGSSDNDTPLKIGAAAGSGPQERPPDHFFKGQIDDVAIWNRTLTQEEIRATICAKIQGNEPGLVGYWNFDDKTANDQSRNSNHGTIHGAIFSDVGPLSRQPVSLTKKRILIAGQGSQSIIDNSLLSASVNDATDNITFVVLTVPANGLLQKSGATLSANGTFAQSDINSKKIAYVHDGTNTTEDEFDFTVVSSSGCGIASQTFEITVNRSPVVTTTTSSLSYTEKDAPVAIDNALTVTDADANLVGASVSITSGHASGEDILSFIPQLNITGSFNATTGVLTLEGETAVDNYETVLQTVVYSNASDNPSTTQRTVTFTVNDGYSTGSATRNIGITPVDDRLQIVTNDGLTLNEGAEALITNAMLEASDPDATSSITYTLVTPPSHGALSLNQTALAANGTFTQNDIDNNHVSYTHDGSEDTTSDSFTFEVAGITGQYTFNISIIPVDDPSVVAVNTSLTLDEGAAKTITKTILNATDVDSEPDEITYTLVTQPIEGNLSLLGVPLTDGSTFTQEDINENRLSYIHSGNPETSDVFTFQVGSGSTTTSNITVNLVNDAPVAIAQNLVFEDIDDVAIELKGEDEETDDASLTVSITTLPQEGSLYQTADGQTRGAEITSVDTVTPNGMVIYAFAQGTFWDKFGFKVNDGSVDSEESFVTVAGVSPGNILQDPYAVADVGWTYLGGFRRAYTGTTQVDSRIGDWLFYGGTGTPNVSKAYQDIDVSQHDELIDSGNAEVAFSGWIKTLGNGDSGYLAMDFLTDKLSALPTGAGALSHEPYVQMDWQQHRIEARIPKGVRTIRAEMVAARASGGRSTSVYFDYLSLEIIEQIEPVTPPVDTTFSITLVATDGTSIDANNIAAVANDALDGEDERDARAAPSQTSQVRLSFLDRDKVEFDRDTRPDDGRLSHHWFFMVGNPKVGSKVQIFWNPSTMLRMTNRQYQVIRLVEFDNDGNVTNPITLEPQSASLLPIGEDALQFNGNSYVSIPANNSYTSDQFTVAFWVRLPDRSNHYKGMVDKGRSTLENWWFLTYAGGSPQGVLFGVPAGGGAFVEKSYLWGDSDWHHVAGTVDGQNSTKLYVDGVLRESSHGNPLPAELSGIAIGARLGGGDRLKGDIDEVSIWNRALSQAEIQANMNKSLTGNEGGLVGYWPFEEGSGTTTADRTPNNNNGALSGNPTWTTWTPPLPGATLAYEYTPAADETIRFFRLDVMKTSFVATEFPKGPSGWNFFSVPITPQHADPFVNLGDDINSFQMYEYNTLLDGYKIYPLDGDEVSLQTGHGYFTRLEKGVEVDVGGTQNSSDVILELETAGWHAIGNPFVKPVNVANLRIGNDSFATAVTNGSIEATLYNWKVDPVGTDGYEVVDGNGQLEPWEGCWLKTKQAGLTLTIPAPSGLGTFTPTLPDSFKPPLAPPAVASGFNPEATESKGEFDLQFELTTKFASDLITTLGTRKNASTGYDAFDTSEPPMLGQTIAAYFKHDNWEDSSGMYNTDYQPPLKVGASRTWQVEVYTDQPNSKMRLSWENAIEQVPKDIMLTFRQNTATNLESNESKDTEHATRNTFQDMRQVRFVDIESKSQIAKVKFEIRAERFEMTPLSDLEVVAEEGQVRLKWTAIDNSFIEGYTVTRYVGHAASLPEVAQDSIMRYPLESNANQFIDTAVEEEMAYTYQVSVHYSSGVEIKSESFTVTVLAVIKKTVLLQNYPNPFNPETWIPYELEKEAHVKVELYNVSGQIIRTLNIGRQPRGRYTSRQKAAYWDGRNDCGEWAASGVYFYVLKARDFTATRKLAILK